MQAVYFVWDALVIGFGLVLGFRWPSADEEDAAADEEDWILPDFDDSSLAFELEDFLRLCDFPSELVWFAAFLVRTDSPSLELLSVPSFALFSFVRLPRLGDSFVCQLK